ncbi:L-aspartate oxidase [Gordonia sp. PP30]|uniref:L-aspartate oxidase n=1 Tax=Gordonia sp. PP30 TaxID=2935861 RepID=UPI001FFE6BB5|nr:L-aspartate oxidase [Gordonia sp. PP30]UQE74973.1 L-aspartate oxidase [Gordonia sp. PP30]
MSGERRADLVVVGAGVAGLTAALTAEEAGLRVVVLNKGRAWRPEELEQSTSTFYAQGGIAVVEPDNPEDSVGLHVHDTLLAGAGLTAEEPTTEIVAAGWSAVNRLVGWGARFDTGPDGRFLRTREGGHSVRRIIHAGGDATGAQVQAALGAALDGTGVTVLDDARATGILVAPGGTAAGVAYTGPGGDGAVYAPTVLLATGGVGHLYAATTNPAGATGDGIALALRAGAEVADLEFIQFHPTMLYVPGARGRRTLVSEALRGEGGRLVDADGESVTAGVHPLGDLAPRDVVARAVTAAMARTGAPCVYLDFSAIADFERRFPTVLAGVRAAGVSTDDGRLPVLPGAHYLCGGVVTDTHGRTRIEGLLAAGEVARTGLHGANRLASNSLLEGLVMGRRAARVAVARRDEPLAAAPVEAPARRAAADRTELQDLMSARVALRRDASGLAAAAEFLRAAPLREQSERADTEDAALTLTASAVVAAATARTESRGCHYRADFPDAADSAPSRRFRLAGEEIVAAR